MSDIVSKQKVVSLTYTITDDEDNLLETVEQPIHYIHGIDDTVIDKIEVALEGHSAGDEVCVDISPEEAFGPYRPELTYTDDIENVPEEFHKIGAEVEFQNDQNESKTFRVTNIQDGKLTIDGNHPFAGKNIRFNILIRDVRTATQEELVNGIQEPPQLH